MGITVHYRGKIDDLASIEALEDRVIDLALAFGGQVQVWRSMAGDNPDRVVRGLMINLDPGQETLSLLFSPEGYLIPLHTIEEVENEPLAEPPWCFVKTQYGSIEGHSALVETLSELKQSFLPNLEVHDEAEYWHHRYPVRLAAAIERNARVIEAFCSGLEQHPLTSEAREDPEIVASRIERVAQQVHKAFRQRTDQRPEGPDTSEEFCGDWITTEAQWDEIYRQGAARVIRLQRHLESQLLAGKTVKDALEFALNEIAGERDQADTDGNSSDEDLPDEPSQEASQADDFDEPISPKRDPLLERAKQLYLNLGTLVHDLPASTVEGLLMPAGELCGGLAQVLPLPPAYAMNDDNRGLAAVQLKRSLRGAAFLFSGLIRLRDQIAKSDRDTFLREVESLQGAIIEHLRAVRRF